MLLLYKGQLMLDGIHDKFGLKILVCVFYPYRCDAMVGCIIQTTMEDNDIKGKI